MLRATVLGVGLLTSLIGAHAQAALADASTIGAERGPDLLETPYCVAKATPSTEPPQPIVAVCFATRSEMVSFITGGVVTSWPNLGSRPAEVRFINAMTAGTYIIGTDYGNVGYRPPELNWTTDRPAGCTDGTSFSAREYPYWWNDSAASAGSYLGCNVFWHYEHIDFGGAIYDCSPCPDLEYLRYLSSSASWHP